MDLVIGPKGIRQMTSKEAKVQARIGCWMAGGGVAALQWAIKAEAEALPLSPAHVLGRIQTHQVHQVLQRGGRPGCAAAGAQWHPPGEEALTGGVPWVLGSGVSGVGDPPVWVRQELVDGPISTKRVSTSSPS